MYDPASESRISRRATLIGVLAGLLPFGLAIAAPLPATLAFIALRNGRKIGEQHMTFDRSDEVAVHTVTEMAVTLGPVPLYRYRHQAVEVWRNGRFVSLDTKTNDNGKIQHVSARREDAFITIATGPGASSQAPQDALPFTHWNRAIAKAPLFNPQDGKLLRETVAAPVAGSVMLADGSSRQANGVAFRGDAYIEDWYDSDGVWTALTGRLKDGSMLEYRRL